MKDYQAKNIRNLSIVGHGSEGKTTLVEALLFTAGAIDRQGRVEDGSTTTEQVIGKTGRINVMQDRIVVMCDGREVFRCLLSETTVGELLSLGGVVLSGVNALTGEPDTVVAYYTSLGY